MNLGFSYVGLVFLAMLMVPNLIWSRNKPAGYENYVGSENKILLAFERVGEVAVTCLALIFTDFNVGQVSGRTLILAGAFLLLVLYEAFWIRYFKSEKTMADFYSSLLGIPVAGASLPVFAFGLLAVYGKNILLLVAVITLGIGHIGIHLGHKREIEYNDNFKRKR